MYVGWPSNDGRCDGMENIRRNDMVNESSVCVSLRVVRAQEKCKSKTILVL